MRFGNDFLKNNLLKNSFILIIGNILAGLLGYIFHLLISRKLSIQDYGEVQALTSLLNILAVPTGAIYFFIIRHASEFYAKKDNLSNFKFYQWINTNIVLLILILSIFFLPLAPVIKIYLHLPSYANLIIIWLIIISGLLVSVQKGLLTGWQDFKILSWNNVLGAVTKLLIGVILVYIAANPSSALLGFLAGAIFSYLFLKLVINKIHHGINEKSNSDNFLTQSFDKHKIIADAKKFILPILLFSFLISMLNSFDMLMVKNIVAEDLAGIFGAFNILSKIIFWASSSIVLVMLPMACAENSRQKTLSRKTLFYANGLIFAICLSGLLIYSLFPQLIIGMLFGSRYLLLADTLWAFALMALALSLLTMEANLAYSRYDFKISYILFATIILEIIFVYLFSQNLLSIALSIAGVQFAGYIISLIYNLNSNKKIELVSCEELNLPN